MGPEAGGQTGAIATDLHWHARGRADVTDDVPVTGQPNPGSRRTPAGASEPWTVRRLTAVVLTSAAVVMLLVGFIGAVAVHRSTQSVDRLSEQLAPAQVANVRFLVVMLDAENELRAYLISGEPAQLNEHRAALARVTAVRADLEEYARSHRVIATLVARQDVLASAWVTDFAEAAIAEGPKVAASDRALLAVGVRRFAALEAANRTIADRLQARVSAAHQEAQDRLDETVALIATVALIGAVVGLRPG